MFTYWAITLYPVPLFTSKHDRSTSFMIRNRLTCWKLDWVELGFPPFLAPFMLIFTKGIGPKWGTWPTTAPFCPIFVAMVLFIKNVDYSYKNDKNRVSWWWDMTDWWWKVGFTPPAIRHVCPSWHLSSSGVIYIWVLSLEVSSWGTHTLGTFQKYPLFRPPFATSAFLL